MIDDTPDLSHVTWRKSSRSGNGQDCVEVAVVDRGSEVTEHKADADELYLVRDSKNPGGAVVAFTRNEWDAFIGGVKDGEFDPEVLPSGRQPAP